MNKQSNHCKSASSSDLKISLKDLTIMSNDLIIKDKEYTILIKGKKQILLNEKKNQSQLEKSIIQTKKDIFLINNQISKEQEDNHFNLQTIQNQVEYMNNALLLKCNEYQRKTTEENQAQSLLLNKIKSLDEKITQYTSLLSSIEQENSFSTKALKEATEDMQKFLAEI